jgi:ActR/RegA family two-component response regulator
VLIVDSDLSVCSMLSRTLAALGYALDVAYDAEEALELTRQHRYRVGLFGESLSDSDGVALFRELRQSQAGMIGVLMTPVANLPTVARAMGAGMSRIAHVPVDFHDLIQFLTSLPADSACPSPIAPMHCLELESHPFSEDAIAELTPGDISHRLSIRELIEVIRTVEYPFVGKDRLEFFDRDTLERVVHLVRRWCRNRLNRPAW